MSELYCSLLWWVCCRSEYFAFTFSLTRSDTLTSPEQGPSPLKTCYAVLRSNYVSAICTVYSLVHKHGCTQEASLSFKGAVWHFGHHSHFQNVKLSLEVVFTGRTASISLFSQLTMPKTRSTDKKQKKVSWKNIVRPILQLLVQRFGAELRLKRQDVKGKGTGACRGWQHNSSSSSSSSWRHFKSFISQVQLFTNQTIDSVNGIRICHTNIFRVSDSPFTRNTGIDIYKSNLTVVHSCNESISPPVGTVQRGTAANT